MSKFKYDDYLVEDDPFLNPCSSCGSSDFYMDWDEGVYKCNNCDKPSDSKNNGNAKRQKNHKPKVRKFKDHDEE